MSVASIELTGLLLSHSYVQLHITVIMWSSPLCEVNVASM
jgi:hypothetical protein